MRRNPKGSAGIIQSVAMSKFQKLSVWALGLGLAVAVLPWLFPSGPSGGLDATRALAGGDLVLGGGIVFLGGLLTALTPCVYPLIPITVSVFGARKAEGRGKALLLTSAYVFGMGLVFAVLGVLAARTGAAFGGILGKPAFVVGLAGVMLILAASMFGAFELSLPSAWATKLSGVGGSGLLGALLMGSVSGFLAAPCTGPVLTGLLAFVAKTQNSLLGGSLLFIYALGVGVPFFLIGVFTIQLPKSGQWMESVKSVLGIMLVALAALYLKDAFLSVRTTLSTLADQLGKTPGPWIAGGIVVLGVLIGAVRRSFKEGAREFGLKAVGVLLVVAALVLRVGVMNTTSRGDAWLRAGWMKAGTAPLPPTVAWLLHFGQKGQGTGPFDQALAKARETGKPVMIDFFAEWCAACKELDRETYVSADVARESSRFVTIKVDATNQEDAIDSLYERFGIQGLPTVAFVGSDGQILKDPRVTGFLEPDQFLVELRKVR